jgi:bifunctional non-homologous end joining protein LigD
MAPSIGKTPFDRAGWIFELKYDGYRAIVGKHKGEMKMLSRRGNNFLPYFPEIAACLETLPDISSGRKHAAAASAKRSR